MINVDGISTMIGFSIFVYEGVGIVMPIMQTCECPEKFDKLLVAAIATLTVVYIGISSLAYFAYGEMKP